jgi:hypothetical protein
MQYRKRMTKQDVATMYTNLFIKLCQHFLNIRFSHSDPDCSSSSSSSSSSSLSSLSSPDFGPVWADEAAVVAGGNAGAGAAEPKINFSIKHQLM